MCWYTNHKDHIILCDNHICICTYLRFFLLIINIYKMNIFIRIVRLDNIPCISLNRMFVPHIAFIAKTQHLYIFK